MTEKTENLDLTVERVTKCLAEGGVVLLPTDTVLGLAAMPMKTDAVAKLYHLKQRPSERRLPVMIASPDQLETLGAAVTPSAKILLTSGYVPGPLTIALGFTGAKPAWLSERDEVAVRIPNDQLLLAVLKRTGPLFVTSANAHGHPTPKTTEEATTQLNGTPDLVIAGESMQAQPSTLVNCHLEPPVIERVGAIPAATIEALLS